jgi:hypothetical protein
VPDYETDPQSYTATVTVTDIQNNVATQLITVTLDNVNEPPTITGTPSLTVNEDEEYIFNALGADVDVDANLTYSIDNKPDWAEFKTTTGALT